MDNKDHFKINITITVQVDRAPTAPRLVIGRGPQRLTVDSTVIKSVCFRPTVWSRGTLEIEFHTGRTYQYDAVPQGLVDDLLDGRSVGSFFTRKIKPFYTGYKIEAGDAR